MLGQIPISPQSGSHLEGTGLQTPESDAILSQFSNPNAKPGQPAIQDHVAVVETPRAITTTANVYAYMPNASAALSMITYGAPTKAHWLKNKRQPIFQTENENREMNMLSPYTLSRRATFVCLNV